MRKRKHLPIWLKDQIWNRDGGECVDADWDVEKPSFI